MSHHKPIHFTAGHRRTLGYAASLAVLTAMLFATLPSEFEDARIRFGFQGTSTSWQPPAGGTADIDTWLIHHGVASHATFASTLPWWYGPWGPGELAIPGQPGAHNAFYRPVSSLAFWLQWKLFRNDEPRYLDFNVISLVLTGLAFVIASFLLFQRFRIHAPWLAVVLSLIGLFTGFGNLVNGMAEETNTLVVAQWKNLPDILALFFGLLTLSVYLALRRRLPATNAARMVWVVPLFLACGSKEIVLLLPLVLMLLETPGQLSTPAVTGQLDPRMSPDPPDESRQTRRRLLALVLFFLSFNLFRIAVLHGAGYKYGSNREWLRRYVSEAIYPWGQLVLRHGGSGWILGPGLLMALVVGKMLSDRISRARHPYRYWFAYVGACTLLFTCAYALLLKYTGMGGDFSVALVSLTQDAAADLPRTLGYILCPLALYRLSTEYPGLLLFCLGWCLLLSLPNIASPGPMHRDFVPNTGWAWIYGAGFAMLTEDAVRGVTRVAGRWRKS